VVQIQQADQPAGREQRRVQHRDRAGARRQRRSPLRPGLTEERATATLWALFTWHPVALLVEERGWTSEQLTGWLEDLFTTLVR
jgi:hypothetical protein